MKILSNVIKSFTLIPLLFNNETLGIFDDANLKFLSIPVSECKNNADL